MVFCLHWGAILLFVFLFAGASAGKQEDGVVRPGAQRALGSVETHPLCNQAAV